MDAVKFIGKDFGRCAVAYEREDLDAVLPKYSVFLYRDQQVGVPRTLEAGAFGARSSKFHTTLGFGTYGQEPDGSYTLLVSCIDSSD